MKSKILVYIPSTLVLDELLKEREAEDKLRINSNQRRQILLQKMGYLLDAILTSAGSDRKSFEKRGFAAINAKIIEGFLGSRDYGLIVKYLLEKGILECDDSYETGIKSKGYKIASSWIDKDLVGIPVTNHPLRKKILARRRRFSNLKSNAQVKDTSLCQSLIRWFDEKLEFDYPKAFEELNAMYLRETKDLKTKEEQNKCLQRHVARLIILNKIRDKDYYFTRDTKVHRFHSPISNMKREMRKHLTYDGKKMSNIDISNSQPYLINLLLQSQTYDNYSFPHPIPMFCKSLLNSNNEDVTVFESLTKQGVFYRNLEARCPEGIFETYKELKTYALHMLYSDNKSYYGKLGQMKNVFKAIFPTVHAICEKIKEHDKTLLPIMLQRIESKIMLDCVAKRIITEFPTVPIYTIHDSIMTPDEYIPLVKRIISEECTKIIGFPPELKVEGHYTQQNIAA